jgi:yecA family protein
MTDLALPAHDDIRAQIDRLHLGVEASELHGSLCGYLSGGGDSVPGAWLGRILADEELPSVPAGTPLDALYRATAQQLESPDFGLALLLPDDDRPLAERGDALIDWCRGFLGGFGLAAGAEPPLSEESRDALGDLSRMAASDLSYEDPEADEEALAEVAEFVRVAAMLLHSDCVLGPRHRRSLH